MLSGRRTLLHLFMLYNLLLWFRRFSFSTADQRSLFGKWSFPKVIQSLGQEIYWQHLRYFLIWISAFGMYSYLSVRLTAVWCVMVMFLNWYKCMDMPIFPIVHGRKSLLSPEIYWSVEVKDHNQLIAVVCYCISLQTYKCCLNYICIIIVSLIDTCNYAGHHELFEISCWCDGLSWEPSALWGSIDISSYSDSHFCKHGHVFRQSYHSFCSCWNWDNCHC